MSPRRFCPPKDARIVLDRSVVTALIARAHGIDPAAHVLSVIDKNTSCGNSTGDLRQFDRITVDYYPGEKDVVESPTVDLVALIELGVAAKATGRTPTSIQLTS